jgi:hypothetical protein
MNWLGSFLAFDGNVGDVLCVVRVVSEGNAILAGS